MKIKIKLEYTVEMNTGFGWVDLHEDFLNPSPIKKFHKELELGMAKQGDPALIVNKAIEDLSASFSGTLERLKHVEFSYTQEQ